MYYRYSTLTKKNVYTVFLFQFNSIRFILISFHFFSSLAAFHFDCSSFVKDFPLSMFVQYVYAATPIIATAQEAALPLCYIFVFFCIIIQKDSMFKTGMILQVQYV